MEAPDRAQLFGVANDAIESLQHKGHCVVRGLATPQEIAKVKVPIESAVFAQQRRAGNFDERDTYGKAFLQVANLWQSSEIVKAFVFNEHFARVAAHLMQVPAVRLYHDQALCKEPGGGHTPWHQDQQYWPLDTQHTITMWMPLVDVPSEVGSMTFASGSHAHGELGPWLIGDASHIGFDAVVEEMEFPLETHGAMSVGDATFHSGWTLHSAPANTTDLLRSVMTVIYFADGTRVGELKPTNVFDQHMWLDKIPHGERAAGPLNPLLWSET